MTKETEHFDTIIIGGGPSGMSAALWCADLGLNAILLEKEAELGGQLLWTFNAIANYLGAEAANGRDLCDRFVQHIGKHRLNVLVDAAVKTVDLTAGSVDLEAAETISGGSLIIATGVRRRELNIPGENEFRGRGVLRSGVSDRRKVSGKRVVIIGGGDAALENALVLSETAAEVTVIHRRDEFSARSEFVDRVRGVSHIKLVLDSHATAIFGNEIVEAVGIRNALGEASTIPADAVLIRIGVVPNTELVRGQIDLDDRGYILTDRECRTSLPRVFAAGDVANPHSPTINTAIGMAATAVKMIPKNLNFL